MPPGKITTYQEWAQQQRAKRAAQEAEGRTERREIERISAPTVTRPPVVSPQPTATRTPVPAPAPQRGYDPRFDDPNYGIAEKDIPKPVPWRAPNPSQPQPTPVQTPQPSLVPYQRPTPGQSLLPGRYEPPPSNTPLQGPRLPGGFMQPRTLEDLALPERNLQGPRLPSGMLLPTTAEDADFIANNQARIQQRRNNRPLTLNDLPRPTTPTAPGMPDPAASFSPTVRSAMPSASSQPLREDPLAPLSTNAGIARLQDTQRQLQQQRRIGEDTGPTYLAKSAFNAFDFAFRSLWTLPILVDPASPAGKQMGITQTTPMAAGQLLGPVKNYALSVLPRGNAGEPWGLTYIGDELRKQNQLNQAIDALPDDLANQARIATTIWASGADDQQNAFDAIRKKQNVDALFAQARRLYDSGQQQQASEIFQQARDLRSLSYSDLAERNANPWSEFFAAVFLDPLNLLDAPINWATDAIRAGRTVSEMRRLASIAPNELDRVAVQGQRLLGLVANGQPTVPPRTWIANLLNRTPETLAHFTADSLLQSAAQLYRNVDNAADARLITNAWLTDPKSLLTGISGLTSEGFQAGIDANGLYKFGAGAIAMPQQVKAMPTLALIKDELLASPVLTDASFSPLEWLRTVDNTIYRGARQANGLVALEELPFGATRAALNNKAYGQYAIDFYDAKNNLLGSTQQMPFDAAKTYKANLDNALQAGQKSPVMRGLRGMANIQRSFLSDMWLSLRPTHWIRNAASATAATMGDGLYSLRKQADIIADLSTKFAFGAPTERIASAIGSEAAPTLPDESRHISRAIWDKGNPLAAASEAGAKIWTGTTEILGLPFGEQSFYLKAFDRGFSRAFNHAWTTAVNDTLGPLYQSLGVAPDVGRQITDRIVSAGIDGSRSDMQIAARAAVNGRYMPFDLRQLDIPDELVSAEGKRQINAIINEWYNAGQSPANMLPQVETALRSTFAAERTRYADMILNSPGQPGNYDWTRQDILDTSAEIVDSFVEGARATGTDIAAAEQAGRQLAETVSQAEIQALEAFAEEVKLTPTNPDAMNVAFDLLARLHKLKQATRAEVDTLSRMAADAVGVEARNAAWTTKFSETGRLYTQYAADVQAEIDTALTDLRTVLAGGQVERRYNWWDALSRYFNYEQEANAAARSTVLGSSTSTPKAVWDATIEANRLYIDAHLVQMYDAFRRFPSIDAMDVVRWAHDSIDDYGARAAHYLDPFRQQALAKQISWEKYFALRNRVWQQSFDNQVIITDLAKRAIVSTGLGQSADSLRWEDPFVGSIYQLIGPGKTDASGNIVTWKAFDVQRRKVEEFANVTGTGSALPDVPKSIIDAYYRITEQTNRIKPVLDEIAAATPLPPKPVAAPPVQPATAAPPTVQPPLSTAPAAPPIPPAPIADEIDFNASPVTAQSFATQMRNAYRLDEDQAAAVASLAEARASVWAKQTGRPASEWYGEHISAISAATPNNLDPAALIQVNIDTPEFRRWFRGSTVVDSAGSPLQVYHGSPFADFTQFNPNRISSQNLYGRGFYFTADPEMAAGKYVQSDTTEVMAKFPDQNAADNYAKYSPNYQVVKDNNQFVVIKPPGHYPLTYGYTGLNGGTYPVFLSIKHPFTFESKVSRLDISDIRSVLTGEAQAKFEEAIVTQGAKTKYDLWHLLSNDVLGDHNETNRILQRAGFDGLSVKYGGNTPVFIAFEPTQIKSSIANSGAFDPTNPNILAQLVPPEELDNYPVPGNPGAYVGSSNYNRNRVFHFGENGQMMRYYQDGKWVIAHQGKPIAAGTNESEVLKAAAQIFTDRGEKPPFRYWNFDRYDQRTVPPTSTDGSLLDMTPVPPDQYAEALPLSQRSTLVPPEELAQYSMAPSPRSTGSSSTRTPVVEDANWTRVTSDAGGSRGYNSREDAQAGVKELTRYWLPSDRKYYDLRTVQSDNGQWVIEMRDLTPKSYTVDYMPTSRTERMQTGTLHFGQEGQMTQYYKNGKWVVGYQGNAIAAGTDRREVLKAAAQTFTDQGKEPPFKYWIVDRYLQSTGATAKGSATFLDDQRAILNGFAKADVSTAAHEMAHVFRRDLTRVALTNEQAALDLRTAEKWAGVVDGAWSREAEEKFARGFESYLRTGDAPTEGLRRVFEQFKQWMVTIYRSLKGSQLPDVPPEMRTVYDRLLTEVPDVRPDPNALLTKPSNWVSTQRPAILTTGARVTTPQGPGVVTSEQNTFYGVRLDSGKTSRFKRSNVQALATAPTPKEITQGQRIAAPSPTAPKLIGVEWKSKLGEKFSSYDGGLVNARVSDWEKAETSVGSGRDIVHVYLIQEPDGTIKPYGKQTAAARLGVSEQQITKQSRKYLAEIEEAKQNYEQIFREVAKYQGKQTPELAFDAQRRRNPYASQAALNQLNQESQVWIKDGAYYARVPSPDYDRALQAQGWNPYKPAPSPTAPTAPIVPPAAPPVPAAPIPPTVQRTAPTIPSPTAPTFGAPQRPAAPTTQNMFAATAEDLPLISGAAPRVADSGPYRPPEVTATEISELAAMPRDTVLDFFEGLTEDGEIGFRYYETGVPVPLDIARNLPDDWQVIRPAEIWKNLIQYWGKQKQPEMGDVARHMIRTLNDAEDAVIGALPRLAQQPPNALNPAARNAIISAVDRLGPTFDNAVAVSRQAAQGLADGAMLNYNDRRGFDQMLALVFPYHYYWTRGGLNWAKRLARKPTYLNLAQETYRLQANQRQQLDAPQRMDSYIPLGTIANNLIGLGNPLNWMLPRYTPNEFVDPEDARSQAERYWLMIQQSTPGMLPLLAYAADAFFDWQSGSTGADRKATANLRQFAPVAGIAADARQAITGKVAPAGIGPGDPWDQYRVRTTLAVMAQEKSIDTATAQYAQQIAYNLETNQDRYNGIPAANKTSADAAYTQAAQRSGAQRLLSTATNYLTGSPLAIAPQAEIDLRKQQRDYNAAGYDPTTNPYGSNALRRDILDANPALPTMWTRNASAANQPAVSAQRSQRWEALQNAVFGPMSTAAAAAIRQNPAITPPQLAQIKAPYYDLMDGINARFPLAAGSGSSRPPSGATPQERALYELQQIIDRAGGPAPAWPGDNATPDQLAAYRAQKSTYDQRKLAAIESNLSQILRTVESDPTQPWQQELASLVRGQFAVDLKREYDDLAYANPTEKAWAEEAYFKQAARNAQWQDKAKQVAKRVGAPAAQQWAAYHQADDATRTAMREDPAIKQILMAGYNPSEYDAAIVEFGPQAWDIYFDPTYPKFPEGATQDQLNAYYAERDRFEASHPRAAELRFWLNGRYRWSDEASSPVNFYDFGRDWKEAQRVFGPDIFEIERTANAAQDFGAWARSHQQQADKLTGYRQWKQALSEPPTNANQLPRANFAAAPQPTPQQLSSQPFRATYTGPDPYADMTPINADMTGRQPITPTQPYIPPAPPPTGAAPAAPPTVQPSQPLQPTTPSQPYTPPTAAPWRPNTAQNIAAPLPATATQQPAAPLNSDETIIDPYTGLTAQQWAARDPKYAQRQARLGAVSSTFGDAGLQQFSEYANLPADSPQRAEYRRQHPEITLINMVAYDGANYANLQEMFGQEALLAWANTPAWGESEAEQTARKDYLAANPMAWLVDSYVDGRPRPYDPTAPQAERNFGADWAQAEQQFGADIWQRVAAYRAADSTARRDIRSADPAIMQFFDWWYAALPDTGAGGGPVATYRSSDGLVTYDQYGRRLDSVGNVARGFYPSSSGGSGGGGSSGWRTYPPEVRPRYMDERLWYTSDLRNWRPNDTNIDLSWMNAGSRLRPGPIIPWRAPR